MKTLKVETSGARMTVTLNTPPLNILTMQMMRELCEVFASADDAARVVLIRGEGKGFSAGADVKEHLPESVPDMIRGLHELVTAMFAVKAPIVCAMHGFALGGAFEVGSLADFVIATEDCQVGLPEIELGVFPPVAAAWYPMMIGWKRALHVLLMGKMTAREAHRLGLVTLISTPESFAGDVEKTCQRLESLSLPAVKFCKLAAAAGFIQRPFDALATAEMIYVQELMRSRDASEGLRSFLEKRSPQWQHR